MTKLSLARSGRFVALRRADAVEIVDAIGTAPRTYIHGESLDLACTATQLWILRDRALARFALSSGRPVDAIDLGFRASHLISDGEDTAVVVAGDRRALIVDQSAIELPLALAAFPLGKRRVALAQPDALHVIELGRRDPLAILRTEGTPMFACSLLAGRVIAVRTQLSTHDLWTVWQGKTRVHRVESARADHVAIASDTGEALAITGDRWSRIDLRYGQIRATGVTPFPVEQVALSADAQHVLLANGEQRVHLPAIELFAKRQDRNATVVQQLPPLEPTAEPVMDSPAVELPAGVSPPPFVPREATPTSLACSAPHASPAAMPLSAPALAADFVPRALGTPLTPLAIDAPAGDFAPYVSPREHLDDMLDLVAARAARAIAAAWNSGRISGEGDRQPFEREVRALLGHTPGFAATELGEADERVAQMAGRQAGRVRASLAAGVRLPFIELMRELDLSPMAGHVLAIALAPSERGEIARLFGILANDASRPVVDRFLIETLFATHRRGAIAAELAAEAPLRRHGVLQIAGDHPRPAFEAITVDPIVVARLCDPAPVRAPVRPFDELVLPEATRRELLEVTSQATPEPLRLVLRGRRGAGRTSAIAALAERVGRAVAEVDVARLPRAGGLLPALLQQELRRAVLRGCVPIASGLESLDATDAELADRIRHVLRAHPGPLIVRAPLEANLPLDPGHQTIVVPPLDETARTAFWTAALARANLHCRDVDALAARWRIGPGVVEAVIAQARTRVDSSTTADAALHEVARQHVAARLAHIATPVRRLAEWEHVALADDIVDSIREFIGRIAHRKTVLEQWGFDAKVASARGLTALFYGPPGTGKSMVAGLIARELGLELYRIDLSRIVSKWIGETEKNLAEVFDAAEDGQVVLLFDEADSLFAKRTEVKTSVDRYANLEVNYLLQRLDSFEGIAILTTNLDGSIDAAFKRRMSLRLQFPFPDEEMRQRLWAAHIPASAPIAGDFDFATIARKFELSGGYIRNSALRAAYLAAQERRPLSQAHLLRAIALEYRELGKLAPHGRME